MLILLVVLQYPDEQLIALLVDADLERLFVLEQLREDGVGVAESSGVHVLFFQGALHQRVQLLEELEV